MNSVKFILSIFSFHLEHQHSSSACLKNQISIQFLVNPVGPQVWQPCSPFPLWRHHPCVSHEFRVFTHQFHLVNTLDLFSSFYKSLIHTKHLLEMSLLALSHQNVFFFFWVCVCFSCTSLISQVSSFRQWSFLGFFGGSQFIRLGIKSLAFIEKFIPNSSFLQTFTLNLRGQC